MVGQCSANGRLCLILFLEDTLAVARECRKPTVYLQWSITEAEKKIVSADKLCLRMQTVFVALVEHLKEIKASRASTKAAEAAETLRKNNEAVRDLKQFTTARTPTPFPLAKWCRDRGLLAVGDEPVTAGCRQRSPWPNFPIGGDGDEDVRTDLPVYLPSTHSGVGTLLRALPAAMGAERLQQVRDELEKAVNTDLARGVALRHAGAAAVGAPALEGRFFTA